MCMKNGAHKCYLSHVPKDSSTHTLLKLKERWLNPISFSSNETEMRTYEITASSKQGVDSLYSAAVLFFFLPRAFCLAKCLKNKYGMNDYPINKKKTCAQMDIAWKLSTSKSIQSILVIHRDAIIYLSFLFKQRVHNSWSSNLIVQ